MAGAYRKAIGLSEDANGFTVLMDDGSLWRWYGEKWNPVPPVPGTEAAARAAGLPDDVPIRPRGVPCATEPTPFGATTERERETLAEQFERMRATPTPLAPDSPLNLMDKVVREASERVNLDLEAKAEAKIRELVRDELAKTRGEDVRRHPDSPAAALDAMRARLERCYATVERLEAEAKQFRELLLSPRVYDALQKAAPAFLSINATGIVNEAIKVADARLAEIRAAAEAGEATDGR